MEIRKKIDLFLESKKIAVAGVSRNKKFGNVLYKHLSEYDFDVVPVNPHLDEFEGVKCYKSIVEVESCDAILISINKEKSADLVKDAISKGISNIWFQSGSVSEEAIKLCEENNINYIPDECIIMYTEPVKGLHSFHRFIVKLIGKYPK